MLLEPVSELSKIEHKVSMYVYILAIIIDTEGTIALKIWNTSKL